MTSRTTHRWGILERHVCRLDGDRSWLAGEPHGPARTLLFETRKAARDYIREHWGYQRERPDLRAEPHGWRMPRAVRVEIEIRVIE